MKRELYLTPDETACLVGMELITKEDTIRELEYSFALGKDGFTADFALKLSNKISEMTEDEWQRYVVLKVRTAKESPDFWVNDLR